MCVESCGSPPLETSQMTLRLLKVHRVASVTAGISTGLQQRQRDVPELLPSAGAIDLRGFVQLVRDALHAAERDDHHEREIQARRSP